MKTGAKVGLTVAVLAAAVGYMIVTTVQSGEALEYYKHVNEVMDRPEQWGDRTLQLHGNVVSGSILKRKGTFDFKFALHRGGKWVDVAYSGLPPDGFKDCAELIVKGKLDSSRRFAASQISAKCPSKYEKQARQTGCGEELRAAVLAERQSAAGGGQ